MQIGKENETFAEVPVFLVNGLFDLNDKVSETPDVVGGADDFGSRGLVIVVRHGRKLARVVFDEYLMPCCNQCVDAGWGDADATLVVLNLFRHSNNHAPTLPKRYGLVSVTRR